MGMDIIYTVFVRGLIILIDYTGYFLECFGIKLFAINIETVLKGQAAGIVAQAQHPDVVEPMSLYIQGLARVNFSLAERLFKIFLLRTFLEKRSNVFECVKSNPEIAQTEMENPVFLVSVPRTGTTMLYDMLHEDDRFFQPMSWEHVFPTPPGRPNDWKNCRRYKEAKYQTDMYMRATGKDFKKIHPYTLEKGEDVSFLLFQSFLEYENSAYYDMKEYNDWYFRRTHDQLVRRNEFLKLQLQCIAYKSLENTTLFVKCHPQLLDLDAIFEVFPGARIIMTHRRPEETIPSYSSLIAKSRGLPGPQSPEFGRNVARMFAKWISRSMKDHRRRKASDQTCSAILHINYNDLIRDPMKEVQKVYHFLQMKLDEDTKGKILSWLDQNPQNKHGKHIYSLEVYGLDEKQLHEQFKEYHDFVRNELLFSSF